MGAGFSHIFRPGDADLTDDDCGTLARWDADDTSASETIDRIVERPDPDH